MPPSHQDRDSPTATLPPRWPLASRLDAAIRRRYPSYTAFARAAGLPYQQAWRYVRGLSTPSPDALARMLAALDLASVEDLIRRPEPGPLEPFPRGRRLSPANRALLDLLRSGPGTTAELADRLPGRRVVAHAYPRLHSLRTQGYVTRIEAEPGRPWTLTEKGRARAASLGRSAR